ncbi:serine/threonine-protein kinase [Actinomadura kijaniata]|uniref:serine/threonine-protein kinase n=1 Tax=Actinomadura kijaniata TaxID=46161 RepID=UPI0031DF8412
MSGGSGEDAGFGGQPLQPGDPRLVGEYELVGRLGQGGMGTVYLGRTPSGRAVAVKIIRADFAGLPQLRKRFAAEVRAAMNVNAFYTAAVVDADPEGDPPWLVTAYIPGPTLTAAVDGHGPLPPDTVRLLGAHLAEGLAAIHKKGLVHRDLKPGNVILAADGPRIIDFGIALAADTTMHTVAGGPLGTPGYMSPEQARGDAEIDWRSDVFALGGVLTFAATGEGPFGSGQPHALIYRICAEEPRLGGVPAELRDVVAACLAKDPAARPEPREILRRLRLPRGADAHWLPGEVATMIEERSAPGHPATRAPASAPAAVPTGTLPAFAPGTLLERGEQAIERGELNEARLWLEQAVSSEDPDVAPRAMRRLALIERRRSGADGARRWYERAAASGHPEAAPKAMRDLALLAREEGDRAGVRRWYERAAATEHEEVAPRAMRSLGLLAQEDDELARARSWYERAVASDHPAVAPIAMNDLGVIAEKLGDLEEARSWYERAAASGDPEIAPRAMHNRGFIAQDEGDPVEARSWWERAAATDHPVVAPAARRNLRALDT